jgi:hypothetical protein
MRLKFIAIFLHLEYFLGRHKQFLGILFYFTTGTSIIPEILTNAFIAFYSKIIRTLGQITSLSVLL